MKISIRLAIYSVIITIVAIVTCCILLLITTANNHINNAVENGIEELRMLNSSFSAEIDVVNDNNLSDTAKRSLVLFVFRKYADSSISGAHYILSDTNTQLYNDCPIDPRPLLLSNIKESNDLAKKSDAQISDVVKKWPYVIAELKGRMYLAVGHWSSSLGNKMNFEHEIYLVRDITNVYNGIALLGIRFAVIGLVTIILSAVLMIFLVRRVMRPLGGLQKTAAALAEGQYDNRIQVRGRDEISALGTSFNKMADAIAGHIDALENTAEQRKLLLSALTHELKTPMTAIIGYSEALMRIRLQKEQQEESIAYINSECKRVERLSQKMMQLITLQGGESASMKLQPLKRLYEAVEMTLESIAQQENIELAFIEKDSPVFEMDIDMMASVLINLFDNARKAGAKHITFMAEKKSISVKDDGVGIPQDEIEKIIQPFYMVDKSHCQSKGGSGLGLALCELIIKTHKAQLLIESQIGKGTIATILFKELHFDNKSKNT